MILLFMLFVIKLYFTFLFYFQGAFPEMGRPFTPVAFFVEHAHIDCNCPIPNIKYLAPGKVI
jgi:hypothetical protein